MIRVFSPSTIEHAWRETFAICAVAFYLIVALYFTLDGVVWVCAHVGSWDWSFVPVTA